MRTTVYVGTAGWAIPRAHASHFPPHGTGLQRYAARLNAAEINSSFYRSHRSETWARWAASVPPEFRFAVKIPKAISHDRQLRGVSMLLQAFLRETGALGEKRGPLLLQLPPKFAFDTRVATRFFDLFRTRYDGPIACEPRNPTWASAAAGRVFVRFRIARVVADPPRSMPGWEPDESTEFVYFRLHGSPRPYFSRYSSEQIEGLAARLRGTKLPAWCIFDNTGSGAAAANAVELTDALTHWASR